MLTFPESGVSIEGLLSSLDRVVVFGAGAAGVNALKVLEKKNIEVLFVCDNDEKKHGSLIGNIPVESAEKLKYFKKEFVLIASDYCRDIARQLDEMGVADYCYFGFCFDYERWRDHIDPQYLLAHRDRILKACNLFEDEVSRKVFVELVLFRFTGRPNNVLTADFDEYLHPQVQPVSGDIIVDGGAWEGDTAITFCNFLDKHCRIYSFEPGCETFNKLQENLIKEKINDVVTPVGLGLWDKKDVLRFSTATENSMQYQVDDNGELQISVTSIDSFFDRIKDNVSLIKMDIEGSEIRALKGAKRTIGNDKPRLQVCVYHLLDDLWELPLLIKRLWPEYKLYMGHHKQNFFESILYASV